MTIMLPLELENILYHLYKLLIHLERWALARHENEFCIKRQFMNFKIRYFF